MRAPYGNNMGRFEYLSASSNNSHHSTVGNMTTLSLKLRVLIIYLEIHLKQYYTAFIIFVLKGRVCFKNFKYSWNFIIKYEIENYKRRIGETFCL